MNGPMLSPVPLSYVEEGGSMEYIGCRFSPGLLVPDQVALVWGWDFLAGIVEGETGVGPVVRGEIGTSGADRGRS